MGPFAIFFVSLALAQNIYDPHVWNYYFYVNTNPDLIEAGITSLAAAEAHWQNYGINEGRQACGSFDTKQYLQRYPDILAACGTNFQCALDHYLTNGINEGRLGYVEGGAYGRYTISDLNPKNGLFLGASTRFGGGIDSLVWNSFEFVNQWDHGRELQVAVTNGFGECYNPTECGANDDGIKTTTTTVLQAIVAKGQLLQSQSLPAFWLAPGEKEANPTPTCSVAINTEKVSNYQITKSVAIISNEQVQYNFSVYVPDLCSQIQIEGPTEYLPIDFNHFFTINSAGTLTPVDTSSGEVNDPLIFSVASGEYAVGAVGESIKGWMLTYAKFYFPSQSCPPDDTSKWSAVYRLGSTIQPGTRFAFETNLCVGTLSSVTSCMTRLLKGQ